MTLEEFTEKFAEQFTDTDPEKITPSTKYRDLEEWSSLMALYIMAMISDEMDVIISAQEFREVNTVEELYNLVLSK